MFDFQGVTVPWWYFARVVVFLVRTAAMLIPLGTDALLYHFPWATIGLIAVNVVCFAVTRFGLDAEALWPWMLQQAQEQRRQGVEDAEDYV